MPRGCLSIKQTLFTLPEHAGTLWNKYTNIVDSINLADDNRNSEIIMELTKRLMLNQVGIEFRGK